MIDLERQQSYYTLVSTVVDNRPGFIPDGLNNFRLRNGSTSNDLPAFRLNI